MPMSALPTGCCTNIAEVRVQLPFRPFFRYCLSGVAKLPRSLAWNELFYNIVGQCLNVVAKKTNWTKGYKKNNCNVGTTFTDILFVLSIHKHHPIFITNNQLLQEFRFLKASRGMVPNVTTDHFDAKPTVIVKKAKDRLRKNISWWTYWVGSALLAD